MSLITVSYKCDRCGKTRTEQPYSLEAATVYELHARASDYKLCAECWKMWIKEFTFLVEKFMGKNNP